MGRLLIGIVAGSLITCGSATATPVLRNPCTLLTAGQVAPILGGPPSGHALKALGKGRTCIWIGPAGTEMQASGRLYVSVSPMTRSRFISNQSAGHGTWIHGLAGLAYQDQLELLVWKDNTVIVLINPNLVVQPARALALARTAVSNL